MSSLRADLWYVGQVANFAWRQQLAWAFVISTLFVGRTALDWLVPAADFASRAATSTYLTASVLLFAGAVASWRSRTIAVGLAFRGRMSHGEDTHPRLGTH